jgi:thiamine-phosphate pyrophosphorylase
MSERHARIEAARLYLVVDAEPGERVLPAALAGGVDVVQLRDKGLGDEQLVAAGRRFRELCDEHGALLIVNDRPDLALACGADGVHVGQDDRPVEEVRSELGDELLIGLSTHSPQQVYAARSLPCDYIGVGPVFETPTKPGRPAVGVELVAFAAAHAGKPFFAIGGIDESNAGEVARVGASRIAVVRAIRDAPDPGAAARALRAAVEGAAVGSE